MFARQHAAFADLLRGFGPAQWRRPTVCPGWDVKDVAAHVLGDHLSRLSRHRDGYSPQRPRDGEALPAFLDRFNDEWVTAARRISPRLLIEQLSITGNQVVDFWQAVDLNALGEAVSWADPGPAPLWLDAARDFSEYWTHHQQICEATDRAGLTGPDYLGPVIDTFMRALPHTLRDVTAPDGTVFELTVTGPSGGEWTCTLSPSQRRVQGSDALRRPQPRRVALTMLSM